jgi:hypothetical protein
MKANARPERHTFVKATFYNALNYIQYLEGKLKLGDVKKAEVVEAAKKLISG